MIPVSTTITIRAIGGFYWDKKRVAPGDVISVPKLFGAEICASNKAERVSDENPESLEINPVISDEKEPEKTSPVEGPRSKTRK